MSRTLSIIAAVTNDRAIGRGGDQPIYIKDDLRHFKALTMGRPVIMGRRTWQALPRKPLPGRDNIVLSRNATFQAPGAKVCNSLDTALDQLGADVPDPMVIGGASVYERAMAMPQTHTLYLTRIDTAVPDADTFFPDYGDWQLTGCSPWMTDRTTGYKYRYEVYERSGVAHVTEKP